MKSQSQILQTKDVENIKKKKNEIGVTQNYFQALPSSLD